MNDQETVANMERVWQAIIALGSTFTEQEWKAPTDCPGWTVQDQVAHMLGSESRLLGLPVPDHTPQHTSHVKWIGNSKGLLAPPLREHPQRPTAARSGHAAQNGSWVGALGVYWDERIATPTV